MPFSENDGVVFVASNADTKRFFSFGTKNALLVDDANPLREEEGTKPDAARSATHIDNARSFDDAIATSTSSSFPDETPPLTWYKGNHLFFSGELFSDIICIRRGGLRRRRFLGARGEKRRRYR